jgi:sensor histidine kinase YesM
MPITRADPSTDCAKAPFTHPLEMIPVFRRWPQSAGRDLVYTLLWNTLFALVFAGMQLLFDPDTPLAKVLEVDFVFAQCIGLIIHALFNVGNRLMPGINRSSKALRYAYYSTIPTLGVFAGYWLGAELLGFSHFVDWLFTWRGAGSILFVSFVVSVVLSFIFAQRERAARAEAAAALEQARVAAAEREATVARLKMLEAQVEPHFLYNTLAHVVSLIDGDPPTARRMIERLIDLLRSTAAAPNGQGTLAEQVRWLRAYLELIELRMGGRLQWRIDVPADLLGLRIPPMVLQPVVENAVKHGLEPKVEGGRVEIFARRDADSVHLVVRDSGLGFPATRPQGSTSLGLANLRARLTAWYGDAARLIIEDNPPAGACVSVVVPREAA